MELLGWIIVGLFAGAIARLVMPGRDPGGCVVTILLGIAGALVPVAFAWWQQEQSTRVSERARPSRPASSATGRFVMDEAIIRGGRVYL